ncbi:MAG: non-canonical purine NTP pyrophosphatase [Bdellovibrionota bacterium]|nr:MAG: non-canonical purine NTP pyrophosphatase [Bdellovibrionota bacterium]
MLDTLVIGTSNPGKRREIQALLEGSSLHLVFSNVASPEETGSTFFDNALIKARATAECESARFPPHTFFAGEDSGICVPALGGAPGIYSARYSLLPVHAQAAKRFGAGSSIDVMNNQCLLEALASLPTSDRSAYYESRLVVVNASGEVIGATSGRAHGVILSAPRGTQGFGYDPIFQDLQGDCWGMLDPQLKNRRSHRAKAFEALLTVLRLAR